MEQSPEKGMITDCKIANFGPYVFRNGKNIDGQRVRSIIFNILDDYGLKPDLDNTDKDLCDIEKHYENGYFGVIVFNDVIVGSMALYPLSKSVIELRKMYLLSKHRGQGIGKNLVEQLINLARKMGYNVLELETASALVEARGLYEKMGFVEKNIENRSERCDRVYKMKLS